MDFWTTLSLTPNAVKKLLNLITSIQLIPQHRFRNPIWRFFVWSFSYIFGVGLWGRRLDKPKCSKNRVPHSGLAPSGKAKSIKPRCWYMQVGRKSSRPLIPSSPRQAKITFYLVKNNNKSGRVFPFEDHINTHRHTFTHSLKGPQSVFANSAFTLTQPPSYLAPRE